MSVVPPFLDAAFQSRGTRFCHLAAATLVGFEYLITFGYEVEYFWKKRWSLGKVIFLWVRYFGFGAVMYNVYAMMQEHPTADFCRTYFEIQGPFSMMQVLHTQIILELRLYAMYGSNRKILYFFVWLNLAEILVGLLILENIPFGSIRTNQPVPGVWICADADPPHRHFIAWFLAECPITELILLGLVAYHSMTTYFKGFGGLADLLITDSVFYFVVIFSVYATTSSLWFWNNLTMNETFSAFLFSLPFLLANRLLINIRVLYYEDENSNRSSIDSQESAIPRFRSMHYDDEERESQRSVGALSCERLGERTMRELELETFDEARGF